ncbi:signal peptide protein, partial [Alkalispirochaeta odontotermitis]
MKLRSVLTLTLAVLMLATLVPAALAQPPKMKMTTEVPPGIATPDELETRIGTLKLFDGVPDEETARKVYDNLDFQRAVQAYLNSIHIASMSGMRKGLLTFGPANTTALLFENQMDSKALWLTPNTVSIYMVLWLEL